MRNNCFIKIDSKVNCVRWSLNLLIISFSLILINLFALLQSVGAQTQYDQVGERLRNRIEAAGIPPELTVQGEFIHASLMLPLFYERRNYKPAWSTDNGPLSQAEELLESIRHADREGLRPQDYHLTKIETTIKKIQHYQNINGLFNPSWLVDLDLLLTDAFMIYGSHLLAGRIDPETIDPEWQAKHREDDIAKILQDALDSYRIKETLNSFLPKQLGYLKLRETLSHYREIAQNGGWPTFPNSPQILRSIYKRTEVRSSRRPIEISKSNQTKRIFESGRRPVVTQGGFIKTLRRFLTLTGDLDPKHANDPGVYDPFLKQAVCKFQKRHALEIDGIVGPATLTEMNVSVEERIHQIELNMERCRWLPQDFGKRYVLINIANYELDAIENNSTELSMKVVVGKPYRRTPVFSDKMTYLVFNPYWHVPSTIATEDMLPQIRKDPDYFARNNIKVLQGQGRNAKEINPDTIDWSMIDSIDSNFLLRQEPGPRNPLGRIKFMFPNKYQVYIHDTPARGLFERNERTFSSGCIRVENPVQLAEFVLGKEKGWTRQEIISAIENREEQTVALSNKIPVHLLYLTAWVKGDGRIYFRNDVYERDKPLLEALRKSPPDITNINRRWCQIIILQPKENKGFMDWSGYVLQDLTTLPWQMVDHPFPS